MADSRSSLGSHPVYNIEFGPIFEVAKLGERIQKLIGLEGPFSVNSESGYFPSE
jgi:hypothetical protein